MKSSHQANDVSTITLPFYTEGNQVRGTLRRLSKAPQLESSGAWIQTQVVHPQGAGS